MQKPIITFTFFILALLLASLTVPVLAQALTVTTDKDEYRLGETVKVSGTAPADAYVTIQILNPDGQLAAADTVKAGADGTFTASFKLPSTIPYGYYTSYGTYTVKAYYLGQTASKSFTLSSGAEVSGTVVDEATGKPVQGVTIRVLETAITTTTGADGAFKLSVSPGSWTLDFSRAGYISASKEVTIAAGETVSLGLVKVKSIETAISELKTSINSLSARLDDLEKATKTDISGIKDSIAKLSADLKALSDKLTALSADLTKLSSDLKSVTDKVNAVSGKVDKAASDLAALGKSLEATTAEARGLYSYVYAVAGLSIVGLIIAIVAIALVYRKIAK